MRNYRDTNVEKNFLAQGFTRTHPWTDAVSNESHRYYDFKNNPELIETSLEDFVPFDNYPAVQTFYTLLRWLNGADSIFESNDCALLNQIEINTDRNDPEIAQQTHRIRGRLMFFFREHILNSDERVCQWLWNDLLKEFDKVDPEFTLGIVGYSKVLTAYLSLPKPLSELSYESICLTFFAWGNDENITMGNLQRTFLNTLTVLKNLSHKGITKQLPQRGQLLLQKVSENDAKTLDRLMTERQI